MLSGELQVVAESRTGSSIVCGYLKYFNRFRISMVSFKTYCEQLVLILECQALRSGCCNDVRHGGPLHNWRHFNYLYALFQSAQG